MWQTCFLPTNIEQIFRNKIIKNNPATRRQYKIYFPGFNNCFELIIYNKESRKQSRSSSILRNNRQKCWNKILLYGNCQKILFVYSLVQYSEHSFVFDFFSIAFISLQRSIQIIGSRESKLILKISSGISRTVRILLIIFRIHSSRLYGRNLYHSLQFHAILGSILSWRRFASKVGIHVWLRKKQGSARSDRLPCR